ncbi:unnamed protein product [Malus baccata var. baccata]
MTTHKASSSSSFKSKLWNYDVFLSFRGVDTRYGFTGHLYAALTDRGYRAYIDEDGLERGEEIKAKLFRAIEEARISIIVFSKSYADSSWCLDELVKIMECRSKLERRVLPIFYHVDPSHVRNQNGDLAQAFQKHEEGIREEKDDKEREAKQESVKQWRKALTGAANLAGQHLQDNEHEAKLIRDIVGKIIPEWLPSTNELNVAKHPVGINSRIQGITSHLSRGGSEVLMVGIWGMGGLGKTTAAKAIYNQIHHMFEFKSFLADVSNTTSKHGLVYLQKTLVSDVLKGKFEISNVDGGITLIKKQFKDKRVLVIMDNTDDMEQLNAIAGNHDWFGPESRIIITTRDEHLLRQVGVDEIYPHNEMNEEEALELFSWHAFRNSWPNEGYLELSRKIVSYCGGLPLALEVFGSFFIKRTIAEWKSELEKLKTTPEGKIIKPLRISFEGLDHTQKDMFLDISCFFIGWDKDFVAKILDGCNFSATIGISVLRERCLITVEDNKLNMHDLVREMAKLIVSEKSPRHPGKWSRLWNRQEVADVLEEKSGTKKVEGLALTFPEDRGPPSFRAEAFANMKKLRMLQLKNVQLNGEYKHLPKELMWLCWERCPLKSIPDDFFDQPRALVILEMTYSKLVQVWEGSKSLKNLKILIIRHCSDLKKSPDISNLPNLEELILEQCESLSEIHPSIGHHKKLSLVNITGCNDLHTLPSLSGLSKLERLDLNSCSWLHTIYDLPRNLKFLDVSKCYCLVTMPNFSKMSNMRELNVCDSRVLTEVPDLDKALNSMTWIDMRDCADLTADFRRNVLKGWTSCGYGGIFLYGNYVPDWFEFVNDGNKVSFDIPPSDGRNFKGLTLLCFYGTNPYLSGLYNKSKAGHPCASIVINNIKRTELQTCIGKKDWVRKMSDVVFEECFIWQGQISNDKLNLQSGDKVDVTFEMPEMDYKYYYATIKGTGVNLVWDKHMKENMHDFDPGVFLIKRHNQGGDASLPSHV